MNSQIRTEYLTITPKMASAYLEMNTNNRRLRINAVNYLANAIKRGEWQTTHQGIAISHSGVILDGQHRLNAIVQAGIPVVSAVTFNQDNDTFQVIDNVIPRNLTDRTNLPVREAEIITSIYKLITNSGARDKVTPTQALDLYEIYGKGIKEFCDFSPTAAKTISVGGMRTAAFVMSIKNKDYAFHTYRNLVLGNVTELSEISQTFVKHILTGKIKWSGAGSESLRHAFMVGMVIFDEDRANTMRITINENTFKESSLKARQLLNLYKAKNNE